jgi:hypothetical protein
MNDQQQAAMPLEEAAEDLLEAVEIAIKAGDWVVDGACDPELAIHRLRSGCFHFGTYHYAAAM